MKKVMFALIAMAVAVCTQAASVDWQLTASGNKGWNVYAFANTTVDALAAICASSNEADWAKLGQKVATTNTSRGTASGAVNGLAGDGKDKVFFVLVQGDVADGNAWDISEAITVAAGSTYEPPASGSATKMTFASAKTGKFTAGTTPGPVDPSDVPEPTSGVLLLLGGAALALRRRRA